MRAELMSCTYSTSKRVSAGIIRHWIIIAKEKVNEYVQCMCRSESKRELECLRVMTRPRYVYTYWSRGTTLCM